MQTLYKASVAEQLGRSIYSLYNFRTVYFLTYLSAYLLLPGLPSFRC